MVGLVFVSHSIKLVEGLLELSQEMLQSNITILLAAGTSDGRIGTDVEKIQEQIKLAQSGDGVVVLADIGSGVMSSQMAIDFLDDETKKMVKLADAPLVEGGIAAAVQASIGSSFEEVIKAAEDARNYSKA